MMGIIKICFQTIFIIILSFNGLVGQVISKNNLSPKELKIYNEAKKESQSGNLNKSIKKYEELLKMQPFFMEGILRLASNFYSAKCYEKSAEMFRLAIAIDPYFDHEMYYSLAMVYTSQKKYLEAASQYEIYADGEKTQLDKVKKAKFASAQLKFIADAVKNPVPFVPVKLGPEINSALSEYSPSIAMDGSTIIFTRNTGQEDFYIATKDSTDKFRKASPLFQLNTLQNEGAHAISADGKFIVFTACDRRDSYGSCDLYYSIYKNGKWTIPANMGDKINTAAWDSQPTLSPDGRTLVFASRRLGTKGGSDLWVTTRDLLTNAWKVPLNLGDVINTEGNDETPFLHADGSTLYFRSDGRPGLGSFDLYMSRKVDSTNQWQNSINLGYPINTGGQEGGLVVSLDGKFAYFASDVDYTTGKNQGNLDIYSFILAEPLRPKPTTFIKGIVSDQKTGATIECLVTVKDIKSGSVIFTTPTDIEGTFISSITAGKNYACIIEKNGYQYYAENFDLTNVSFLDEPYFLDIKLVPLDSIKDSKPVVLQNIFFASGSDVLLPESNTEIELLFQLLANKSDIGLAIIGYTDNVGNDKDNLKLSEDRAKAVQNALIKKGISANRIKAVGKGEAEPIASNDTEEGRKVNRRTEFVIFRLK